jgi:histidyl-tRNA synthetase
MIERVRGFRDSYPEDMIPRQKMFDVMRETARKFYFSQIEIPSLEYLDLYRVKSGEELLTQTFSFTDKGGRELTMVPEATPSVVRMLTSRKDLRKPVKWFCLPKLWRYEEPQSGRSREHTQFNADIFGDSSLYADAEIIGLACSTLDRLGLSGKYKVRVNNRMLMEKILRSIGISDIGRGYSLVDHYRKLSPDEFKSQLFELCNDKEKADFLLQLLGKEIRLDQLDSKLPEKFKKDNEEIISRLIYTGKIVGTTTDAELVYDASVVRGLGYYTGIVFEGFDRAGEFRSIFGGGRYDNLSQLLSGTQIEAVGFGMGDAVLELLLKKNNLWNSNDRGSGIAICTVGSDAILAGYELAAKIRELGYVVNVDTSETSLSNQLKKAASNSVDYTVIIGHKELEDGTLTIRNMQSGKQVTGKAEDLNRLLKSLSSS